MQKIRLILNILGPRFKTRAVVLFFVIVNLAVLQALGLGAVLPVVGVIVKPDLILNNPWGEKLYAFLGSPSVSEFSLLLIIGYGMVYLLLQVANIALIVYQSRFNNSLMYDLSTRVVRGYLEKPYEFYLDSNTSVLVKDIVSEIVAFASQVVMNLIGVVSKIFIILAIFIVLACVDIQVAVFILVGISCFLLLFFRLVKSRLSQWAASRVACLSAMHKHAHQAVSGIKEIRVHGCENYAVEAYAHHAKQYAELNNRYYILSSSTSPLASAFFFGGVLVVLFLLKNNGVELSPYIPLITIYAVGLSRLLPLGTQLFSSMVNVRYAWKSVDIINRALEGIAKGGQPDKQGRCNMTVPVLGERVVFEDVAYRYPNADRETLSDLSLSIPFGSKVAFVGGSGAGKTTTVNLLLGLFFPSHGTISIDGTPLDSNNIRSWREQIGYVPQQIFLLDASLRSNIAFGVEEQDVDEARLQQVVKLARLDVLVDRLPEALDTQVGERGVKLSGGEQQRIGIARALYRNPRVLVLDEPTSALDALTEKKIVDDLLALDRELTIIIVTHRLSSVRFCDEIFFFEAGNVKGRGTYDVLLETCPAFKTLDEAWDDKG